MRESSLAAGTSIGRFSIESFIGAGGMGEVYAARDTQLGRLVAVKILPAARAADGDRVERFLREARAASSLNHPSIVTIFDSGTATLPAGDTVHYLAMELIDGETLTQWARSGRPREKIVAVLTQVAEGLARAHSGGIVHRDLKPDNIMVARGGYAKIVDFGVAKLTERQVTGTALAADTAPSAMLGTASFMSPEQVEGRSVDSRSDVFSFGCVIYAAFQGRSPFERDSTVKTMSAVVHEPPPPLATAGWNIERIARRCLAKDPEERYQSMKDVALDLRETPSPRRDSSPRHTTTWLVSVLLAVAVLGAGAWLGRRHTEPPAAPQSSPPAQQTTMQRLTNTGKITTGGMTPDGKYVVYAMSEGDHQSVWVKQIATGTDVRIIPPVSGFYTDMRVSPDGNYAIYSYASREDSNVVDVFQIPILGGQPRKIISNIDSGIGVAPDGRRIAFLRFSAVTRELTLFVADIETGVERVLLRKTHPERFGSPTWSPDGRRLTFLFGSEALKTPPNIVDFDIETGRMTKIPSPEWAGFGGIAWLPDASGLVLTAAERYQAGQVWYLPHRNGPAKKLTFDLASYGGVSVTADSKALVAHRSEDSSNIWVADAASGKARPLTTGLGNLFGTHGVVWLPDGDVLFTALSNGVPTYRAVDVASGGSREHARIAGWRPLVSPDKTKLAYFASKDGPVQLWVSDINGENARAVTNTIGGTSFSWMPDSRSFVYITTGKEQAAWRGNIDNAETVRLTDRPANTPSVSPDGKWLLCRLRTVDGADVPLWRTALLPADGKGAPRYLDDVPSVGSPHIFRWLPDSRSFAYHDYVNGVSNIWVQDIRGGAPRKLTRFDSGRIISFDLSPDGKMIALSHGQPVNDMVLIRDFR